MRKPKERILLLIQEIENHNFNYYIKNNPLISDYEYDLLIRDLEVLEYQYPEFIQSNSPTQRVGGHTHNSFNSIIHSLPMLSLSNAMSKDEIIQFNQQIKRALNTSDEIEYVAEPKLDGVAVEVVYKNGEFEMGSTRGDGINGEDIKFTMEKFVTNVANRSDIIIKGKKNSEKYTWDKCANNTLKVYREAIK